MQQTINVTVTFDPDDEQEFERIIFRFEDNKTNFLKWVWTMCMGTPWEAAYILANEFIIDDEQLQVFLTQYFSGSTNAEDIFQDLISYIDDQYSGVVYRVH